jgi:flagellar hook-associated protein 2
MASISGVGALPTAALTISGLASGINTDQVIEGLLAAHTRRIDLLKSQQARVVEQQATFKSIEAKLLVLQGSATSLGRTFNGAFDTKVATSSNDDLLVAAASSSAVPGSYTLRVNQLAQTAQLASQGYDNEDSAITQGTFQIRVGTGKTTTVTIDGTNNSLRGLADAINAAGADVAASIIHDGTDSRTQPYRLLLTAKTGGAANTIQITNSLGADAGGAFKPNLATTHVGQAMTGAVFAGTSVASSNAGAGGYTGTSNTTYSFTVTNGGTVGTDNGITLSYTDKSGAHTGTITVNAADVDVFKTVAEGIQVKLAAGTLVNGDTFTVDGFVPNVQQAQSAVVQLGSGAGALTVESESNLLSNVIAGVTLDLRGADPSKVVTVAVTNDTESAKEAVTGFVDAFNELMEFIEDKSTFDTETNIAGLLLGDRNAFSVQEDVRRVVTGAVANLNPLMNRLAALGITVNDSGKLEVNEGRLDDVLQGEVQGVALNDVRRLFALDGQSTSSGVRFVTGSTRTLASTTPYQVDLTQVAERAGITAGSALAASTVIDGTNNTLTVTLDGIASGTITLANGTYSRLALAQELEAQINADSKFGGRRVSVTLDADRLKITSASYGFASEVTLGAGTAWTALGFAGTETDRGQDVVGKFIVDGKDEPAVGTGQFLVGNSGNANTADMQVRVTLAASQIVAGPEASITVTRGVAAQLDQVLHGLLDPVSGRMKSMNDGYQASIDDFDERIGMQQTRMQEQQESLVRRFVAMERTIGELRNLGSYLTTQLASIAPIRSQV